MYSEVPIIRPLMVLVESGLNREKALLTRPIYIEKMHFGTETSGLNSEWSLYWDFTVVYFVLFPLQKKMRTMILQQLFRNIISLSSVGKRLKKV